MKRKQISAKTLAEDDEFLTESQQEDDDTPRVGQVPGHMALYARRIAEEQAE